MPTILLGTFLAVQAASMAEENKSASQKDETGKGSRESESKPDQKQGQHKEKSAQSGEKADQQPNKQPEEPPLYKRRGFIPAVVIIAIVLVAALGVAWFIFRQYVSTDDAYIDGHVTQFSARVSSQVLALHIVDNQFVHKGDLLIELDPATFQLALEQAKAQADSSRGKLVQAQAQVGTAKASVITANAQVESAEVQYGNAERNLTRFQQVDERARSRQQLDNAYTTRKNAQAQIDQAKAQRISADAGVTNAEAAVKAAQGELETSQANEKTAEVNLSYCKIYSPVDGRVTQRTVEVGNFVSPGQALLMLVDPQVWVTANFKETQLTHIRPGQPVTISVDAFPGQTWHGHVDSIQAGSGSRFSVLPAQNATGNFVKIVQRVPVKIVFDPGPNTNNAPMLSPGLSVEPRVKVR
ncbi:MAG TPA: HlyD family secretion protein [Verrucomicrobiae bacterium]|jgi:membrane fusion protein (multidrug efflux system)|nr:HlyD family secretion protein [Verrucomicrobiae bacterium]